MPPNPRHCHDIQSVGKLRATNVVTHVDKPGERLLEGQRTIVHVNLLNLGLRLGHQLRRRPRWSCRSPKYTVPPVYFVPSRLPIPSEDISLLLPTSPQAEIQRLPGAPPCPKEEPTCIADQVRPDLPRTVDRFSPDSSDFRARREGDTAQASESR